ncbi:MAG: class I SAM-dependent methyltransferase [Reichenbachiella sp.]|uniref:class I SAM-dependent methyltransferase n=1 Tax=Reichenbachiella sp. TaxID=2184521 RepID=UPI00326519C1
MKKRIVHLIDRLSRAIFYHSDNAKKTFYQLEQISFIESARFIEENMEKAMLFTDIHLFYDHAFSRIKPSGLLLEFGVFKGDSINYFSQLLTKNMDSRRVTGFDSFEGLSEDWSGTDMVKFTFDQSGKMPIVNDNVELIKGWVDETVPDFMQNTEDKIAFMHLDVDTYTPTKTILLHTVDQLEPGTIIIFDELLGYPGWKKNEYKALQEVIAPKWEFEFLSYAEPIWKSRRINKPIRAAINIIKRK